MRISTQMMYEQSMRGVTNSQSLWLSYGEQMSTGKRINRPSDDPIAASQAVVLSQAQTQNSQYALARSFATTKVSLEENVLSQVTTAIQAAQEKIVNAGNGTLSDDDRASLATNLQGIRDQLMNLANSTDGNGRYIFSGYKTEAAAFDQATGIIRAAERQSASRLTPRARCKSAIRALKFSIASPVMPSQSQMVVRRKRICSRSSTPQLKR